MPKTITMKPTHVSVADSDFAGVSEGWSKYYWFPWREYLQRRSN